MREPAPPYAGEGEHALWHVSEASTIEEFAPHRAATAATDEALVWAVDTRHLPMYWFPRDCPRATFWAGPSTTSDDAERFLVGSPRVHAVQSDWLTSLRDATLFAYRLPERPFEPYEAAGGYWISRETVEPLEVVGLADPLSLHADAGIELRLVPDLAGLWGRVVASTLEFSGIRLRNLAPQRTSDRASSPAA